MRPKKSLGQHFLTDRTILQRIAKAALPIPGGTVVEIGAGLGNLTLELSNRADRVIAVEKDDLLAGRLRTKFDNTNVSILHADALEISPSHVLGAGGAEPPYIMAGNLPYNVAQPILRRYLEASPRPGKIVAMVQAEVAESIVAKPGKMTLLSVAVQLYAEAELLFRVEAQAFQPPPKVESAVVRLDVAPQLRAEVADIDGFFTVVRAGFGMKRKLLKNALAGNLQIESTIVDAMLSKGGVPNSRRAQELSLGQWAGLTKAWLEHRDFAAR